MSEVAKSPRSGLAGPITAIIIILAIIGGIFAYVSSLDADAQEELLYLVQDFLPIVMFTTLACLLFTGFPVAFILGGLALLYGLIGYFLEMFSLIEFFNFVPRIWGGAAENLVLVAVPAFVFMGVMMERSGIANDLLYCVQVLLKKVPGSLALAVTIMGTILAAMTGIIGASVTMMTALALPHHDAPGLQPRLSLRNDRRVRDARHPDSTEHHVDHHGRPASGFGRQRVHGSYRTGAFAIGHVPHLRSIARVHQTEPGTAAATRPSERAERRNGAAYFQSVHSACHFDHHDQGLNSVRVRNA